MLSHYLFDRGFTAGEAPIQCGPKARARDHRAITGKTATERDSLLHRYAVLANDVSQAILAGEEMTVLLESAAMQVARALEVPCCLILRYLPDEEKLVSFTSAGWWGGEIQQTVARKDPDMLLNLVLASASPILIDDLKTDLRCPLFRSLVQQGAVSGICAAIPARNRPLGVLGVFSGVPRTFTDEESNFVQAVTSLLAGTVAPRCADEERQESQERIFQAKREWETTVDSLPQFVCLLDEKGSVIRANRAVEDWLLGRVAEVRGKNLHELLHPGCNDPLCHLQTFFGQAWSYLENGGLAEYEAEDRQLNRFIGIQLRPISNTPRRRRTVPDSYAVAIIGDITKIKRAEDLLRNSKEILEQQVTKRTFELVTANRRLKREIEERKRVEQALWTSRERYRLLIETMNEGIAVQDEDGMIVYVNDYLCQMLGYAREELVGKQSVDFIESAYRSQINDRMKSPAGCRGGHFDLEWVRKDRTKVYTNVAPQMLVDRQGNLEGCFAIITDLTDRRRAEEILRRSENELRVLSAQLMTAQEMERKRIAGELHDGIGQSLSAVKFSLENCLALFERDGVESGMGILKKLVPKMQGAIEEVRRISMDLRPSTLDDLGILATIAWFCREFESIYHNIHLESQIRVQEYEVPDPLKTVVYRIMQEALNNIVKHANADSVRVELDRKGGTINLVIQDNGRGFDPEIVVSSNGSRQGLGVTSMKERAEFSGGSFTLCTARDAGTTIHVSWPCYGMA